jgi:hypothetical protein
MMSVDRMTFGRKAVRCVGGNVHNMDIRMSGCNADHFLSTIAGELRGAVDDSDKWVQAALSSDIRT